MLGIHKFAYLRIPNFHIIDTRFLSWIFDQSEMKFSDTTDIYTILIVLYKIHYFFHHTQDYKRLLS